MEKKQYTPEEKKAFQAKRMERYNNAYQDAAFHILNGSEDKVKRAEDEGKDQALIYTFHYAKDRNAKHDEDGNLIVFGQGVRLLDILMKGRYSFLKLLNENFNRNGETKYYARFEKRNRGDGSGLNDWNIYISWRPRLPKKNAEVKVEAKAEVVEEKKVLQKKENVKKFAKKVEVKKVENKDPNSWANKVKGNVA